MIDIKLHTALSTSPFSRWISFFFTIPLISVLSHPLSIHIPTLNSKPVSRLLSFSICYFYYHIRLWLCLSFSIQSLQHVVDVLRILRLRRPGDYGGKELRRKARWCLEPVSRTFSFFTGFFYRNYHQTKNNRLKPVNGSEIEIVL